MKFSSTSYIGLYLLRFVSQPTKSGRTFGIAMSAMFDNASVYDLNSFDLKDESAECLQRQKIESRDRILIVF